MGAAPSPSTASRISSAFGPSTGPPENFQNDSTSPGPAVGEKRKEDLPHSSQQRPVVVKCLVKTECSSRSAGSPTTSVRECVRRRNSTNYASVREVVFSVAKVWCFWFLCSRSSGVRVEFRLKDVDGEKRLTTLATTTIASAQYERSALVEERRGGEPPRSRTTGR